MMIIFWISFSFLSFVSLQSSVKKELDITLEAKKIEGLSPSGLTLYFLFRVVNNSSAEYKLSRTTTRVMVNQNEFFRLDTPVDPPLAVPASSATTIAAPVKITYDYLFKAIPSLQQEEVFTCALTGFFTFLDARRREVKLPIAATANFPLFRSFDLEIHPLQVKEISVGGAELVFSASIINKMATTWILRSLRYRLEIAQHEVGQQQELAENSWGPQEAKELTVPVLLDFFELGSELYTLLNEKEVEVAVTGEMVVESEWGKFLLPFSARQKVMTQRSSAGKKE